MIFFYYYILNMEIATNSLNYPQTLSMFRFRYALGVSYGNTSDTLSLYIYMCMCLYVHVCVSNFEYGTRNFSTD